MEIAWHIFKVVGMVAAMIGSGAVLGYLYAREQYLTELWDKELLIRALQKDFDND